MKTTIDNKASKLISKLRFHSDAGHAWLRVPLHIFRKYPCEVSCFSYFAYDAVYLEEDCDAEVFLEAAGIKEHFLDIVEIYDGDSSPIRKLPNYTSIFLHT